MKTDKTSNYDFPLLSSKNEDGIRMFLNEPIEDCYYTNHIDL